MKHLTIFGSSNIDHVLQVPHFVQPGETLSSQSYSLSYGGKGANQAVACGRLANHEIIECQFFSAVGDNLTGDQFRDALAADNIDTEMVIGVEQATGIALIQINPQGENSIVLAAGANAELNSQLIQEVIETSHHGFEPDCILLQLETPIDGIEYLINLASQRNIPVHLNPAPARKLPTSLLQKITLFTPNQSEAELFTGIKVTDQQTAEQACQILKNQGVKEIIITMGSQGVYYSVTQKLYPSFMVKAVDTTAAGDTFQGGLTTQILAGVDMEQAIKFAQAAAAISVTRHGAQASIPTRTEVEQFLTAH